MNARIYDTLRGWAHTFVVALEQDPTLKGLASEEKKQQAVIWMLNAAEKAGIPLTPEEASNIVEEAVWLVKKIALPAADAATE